MEGEIRITAIATGFDGHPPAHPRGFGSILHANNAPPRIPFLQPAPREPVAPSAEDSDLPAFIQRTRAQQGQPPSPAPPGPRRPSAETPLPDFLRSLRER
jgi:hypothetical protein